jgi:hypothetical protein
MIYLYRSGNHGVETGDKVNTIEDKLASQRIHDFMADPGSMPFRDGTVSAAQRYMAHRIMEFDRQFYEGNSNNQN